MILMNRERVIIYILSRLGAISKLKLVKLIFLISQAINNEIKSFYKFVPYKYGPFSFQLYYELYRLEQKSIIIQDERSVKIKSPLIPKLKHSILKIVDDYIEKFGDLSDDKILNHVYLKYPEYTKYKDIMRNTRTGKAGIVTIGYEGKTIDEFLGYILENQIDVIIDVRKNAFSRKFGFSEIKLSEYLAKFKIKYIHISELGIRSSDRKQLATDKDYQQLFREYEKVLRVKRRHLEYIIEIGREKKVALMCFEKDAKYCHRGIIAKYIENMYGHVVHL